MYPWLQWYLNPERAIILFQACQIDSKGILPKLTTDTNAQENVGRQIQKCALKKRVGVKEVIDIYFEFRILLLDPLSNNFDHCQSKNWHARTTQYKWIVRAKFWILCAKF